MDFQSMIPAAIGGFSGILAVWFVMLKMGLIPEKEQVNANTVAIQACREMIVNQRVALEDEIKQVSTRISALEGKHDQDHGMAIRMLSELQNDILKNYVQKSDMEKLIDGLRRDFSERFKDMKDTMNDMMKEIRDIKKNG